MNIHFSAPSKTFLSGEYAVLAGGPALLLNTEPRFTLTAEKGETSLTGIPGGSPAYRWLEARSPLLKEWNIKFHDPHDGRGGFGASSAQFLFVHALTSLLQISVSRAVEGLDLPALLKDFKTLTEGKASGADIMGQAVGHVASVHVGNGSEAPEAQGTPWPFPELNFTILRTGNKVQTHQHLNELEREPLEALLAPANQVNEAFRSEGSADMFVATVKTYAQTLRELHLQAPSTLALLKRIEEQGWCKAAKGCGALGADTILVMYAREEQETAKRFFTEQKFEIAADNSQLSEGLQMKWSWT